MCQVKNLYAIRTTVEVAVATAVLVGAFDVDVYVDVAGVGVEVAVAVLISTLAQLNIVLTANILGHCWDAKEATAKRCRFRVQFSEAQNCVLHKAYCIGWNTTGCCKYCAVENEEGEEGGKSNEVLHLDKGRIYKD